MSKEQTNRLNNKFRAAHRDYVDSCDKYNDAFKALSRFKHYKPGAESRIKDKSTPVKEIVSILKVAEILEFDLKSAEKQHNEKTIAMYDALLKYKLACGEK